VKEFIHPLISPSHPSPHPPSNGAVVQVGSRDQDDKGSASAYDPRASTWRPYLQNHTLKAYCGAERCLSFEVTPTEHGAIMRLRFPPATGATTAGVDGGWDQTRRVSIIMNDRVTQADNHGPHPVRPWKNDTVALGTPGNDGHTVSLYHSTRIDHIHRIVLLYSPTGIQ
jgi:hypothetical protein